MIHPAACPFPFGLDSASPFLLRSISPPNLLSSFSLTFPLEIHPPRQPSIQLQLALSVECPLSCAFLAMVQVGVHSLRRSYKGRPEKLQPLCSTEATGAIASDRENLRMSGLPRADVQLQNVRTGAHQNALPKRTYKGPSSSISP